jgi:Arc/MetJ-type ribon-helix-helix transcriptional regulator
MEKVKMTEKTEKEKKVQTKNVGVRMPLALCEEMDKLVAAGKFSNYSDIILSLIRDYLVREEMKKVQISELSEFFRSDDGRELISELVDQEIYKRAVESSMARR